MVLAFGLLLTLGTATASASIVERVSTYYTGSDPESTANRLQHGSLEYRGLGTEANNVGFSTDATDYIIDDSVPVQAGEGCRRVRTDPETRVRCKRNSSGVVTLDLGDGDDAVLPTNVDFVGFLMRGGDGDDTLRGSSGNGSSVSMYGNEGRDTYVSGNQGNFELVSYGDKSGNLTITLDDRDNDPDGENVPIAMTGVTGGSGNDLLTGSRFSDHIDGSGGSDTVLGGGGNDRLYGGPGTFADVVRGEADNDLLMPDGGADDLQGGDGTDRYEPQTSLGYYYDASTDPYESSTRDVTVTLDDVANDGQEGEHDNVHADIENLTVASYGNSGSATFIGDADPNVLIGGSGPDVLDGGAGRDVYDGARGNDTLRARDGLAERVECGEGYSYETDADSATVDADDAVLDCESVDRPRTAGADSTPPPPAPTTAPSSLPADDRPPTADFASPGVGALLRGAATIAVTATDDRAVSRVLLMDDGEVVGTDTSAPYTFRYQPGAGDIGRNTLTAVAVDSGDQATTAVRPVRVDRLLPAITATLATARDRRAPYAFAIAGTVTPPAGVSAAQGCAGGRVLVQARRGTRVVASGRVAVSRSCRYAVRVRPARAGGLRIAVRWLGNAVLRPRSARTLRARAG